MLTVRMVPNLINRILIVGLGSAGIRHLRLARELFPAVEIKVLRHKETIVSPGHGASNLSNLEDAIAFAPNIAVIANPSTNHLEIAQSLADVGTHLLVEKPISSSLMGVQRLIDTCNLKKTTLMVGYNLRYSASLLHFFDLIKSDYVGEVFSVRCEVGQYLPSWRPDGDYRNGVSANQKLGGGVLLELSHEIDYLQWIFGEIDWVSASLSRQSLLEIDVEDSAHLIMGFKSQSADKQLIATLNLDFIRQDLTRFCVAIGDKGSLRWDGINGQVLVLEKGGREWKVLFTSQPSNEKTYLSEWLAFIDRVKNLEVHSEQGQEEIRVMEVIESVRFSSKRKAQVLVSEIRGMNWS
jgi:predicted dehydrogenase